MKRLLGSLLLCVILVTAANAESTVFALTFDLTDNVVAIVYQNGRFHFGVKGDSTIRYDPVGTMPVKVGNVAIKYDPNKTRVIEVDGVTIKYDYEGVRVTQIGNTAVKYDPTDQYISRVGGATIKFTPLGDQVASITGSAGPNTTLFLGTR